MTYFQTQFAARSVFKFDTETFLISPGALAPPIVCAQWWSGADASIAHARGGAQDIIAGALAEDILSGHNVSYDLACIAATWPELTPAVFAALDEDRAVCTMVAARMWDIAQGRLSSDEKSYGLGPTLARWCPEHEELNKEDPWRLLYGTLYSQAVADWPAAAIHYALQDARAQHAVTEAMIERERHFPGVFEDLFRQTRRAFWHHLISCWGVRTDPRAVEEYHAKVKADWARDRKVCIDAGLVRPGGTKDTKAAQAYMERKWAERFSGDDAPDLPRTAGGGISLSEDSITLLGDPLLKAYQNFGSLGTLMGRIEKLRAGTIVPIQARFRTPLDTGRSSCTEGGGKGKPDPRPTAYGFQMHNPPAAAGLRECFWARPGYVLCSVDYDGFELRTWAQVCLWAVGFSKLAEVLNSTIAISDSAGKVKEYDRDPHTELAAKLAGLTIEEAYALRARKNAEADAWDLKFRQSAKPANFGFPGGMGAQRFVDAARMLYDVTVSLEEAFKLRQAWKETWVEAQPYFDWADRIGDGNPIVSFVPPSELARGGGMIRGHTSYTQRCNHPFQNLAASAAGAAGWALAREMYLPDGGPHGTRSPLFGSRPWAFLHDEFVLEIPEDRAHEAGERQAQVQREVAQRWIPDVKITCAPALMKRWAKKAKTIYREGRLVPWDVAA